MKLSCGWCGQEFELRNAEYNRQRRQGRSVFFCSISCAAYCNESRKPHRHVPVVKVCPTCGREFDALTGPRSPRFCSRSCASKGSVTECRRRKAREVARLNSAFRLPGARAKAQRAREAWKYVDLRGYLESTGQQFTFEYPLPGTSYIYDLALPDSGILVEFDSRHHASSTQRENDHKKDLAAALVGWQLVRVATPINQVIAASALRAVLESQDFD